MAEEQTLAQRRPFLFGKQNLFSSIGKTLTAASLGLQGKDPSVLFEDDTVDLADRLREAQLAQISGNPQLAEEIANSALGIQDIQVVSPSSQNVIKSPNTSSNIPPDTIEGSTMSDKNETPKSPNVDKDLKKRSDRFVAKSTKIGNVTLENVDAKINERISEKAADESFKQTANFIKQDENFRKVVSLFGGVIARQKAKGLAQKKIIGDINQLPGVNIPSSNSGLGLVEGIIGKAAAGLKDPDAAAVSAEFGQSAETTFALNSILTGQNRVIKGITEKITKSIPGGLDPSTFVADKTAQSISNAFRLRKALKEAQLTPEVLRNMDSEEFNQLDAEELINSVTLTSDEERLLNEIIESVLETPPAKQRDLENLSQPNQQENLNIDDLSEEDIQNLSDEQLRILISQ